MKSTKKIFTKARFSTDATATNLNFDQGARAVTIGRDRGIRHGYVGRVCESSKGKSIFDASVWMNTGFPSVIGVFGMRGTGKSFNLGVFTECLAGDRQVCTGNDKSPAVVIFDVQNQFWTSAMQPTAEHDSAQLKMLAEWYLKPNAVSNVCCWTPTGKKSPLPGAREYQIHPDQLDNSDWLALLEQERYSPMGQALIELLRKAKDCVPRALAKMLHNAGALPSAHPTTVDGLRWRLESLAESDLIGAPGVDIKELLVPGRVSVMLLRDLPESLRALTAATVVRQLAARMTQFHQTRRLAERGKGAAPKVDLPHHLWCIMDEAHVIAPREGKTPANAPLVDYVKRGRDSGLSLIFATQQPSAVDNKLMSQVDITFTHALGFETDVQAAIDRMPTRKPAIYRCGGEKLSTPGDLIRSLKPGEAIIADSASQRPFIAQMRPRLSLHGGDTPT